ncbi:MAG: EAL and GGDEF domain-containing protein [Deltaproteobacteria bacterium]|nr:EAL and GGDEF domain-containing protein [Deltaproteobacteria bacterium]
MMNLEIVRDDEEINADRVGFDLSAPSGRPLHDCFDSFRSVNIIALVINEYHLFEYLYGLQFIRTIEEILKESLQMAMTPIKDKTKSVLDILTMVNGEYLILFPNPPEEAVNLPDEAYALKLGIQNEINKKAIQLTGQKIELGVGYAVIVNCEDRQKRKRSYLKAMNDARCLGRRNLDINELKVAHQFREILEAGRIAAHYQPIFDMVSGRIMGWEALSRGPEGTSFYSPLMLFDIAEQLGLIFALEKLCREKAINRLGRISNEEKLFLNIHPRTVVDPSFSPGKTLELITRVGLTPENVVFEITERHSIKDFALFHQTIDHYRSQGFKVALDDMGTGYSGLSNIAELRPDFIKIDMSLVRGIDRNPTKRALLETFITFANKIGSKIIAEGIETKAEASCLIDIGTHFGQGFYLGKPQYPKSELNFNMEELRLINMESLGRLTCSVPIGQLSEIVEPIDPADPVRSAQICFEKDRTRASIVVATKGKPLGLIMDYHLGRKLSGLYGVPLYYNRPISIIMDPNPLIVDKVTPLEQVAKMAMSRDKLKTYDDIIVTQNELLQGVVSVQKILDHLAKVNIEMAKGTNPLSGLPGNVAIERELENRLKQDQPFALIYADLDNFKVYNDTYGFKKGDQIILLTAKILDWAGKRHGHRDDFLAHIGGDDFVLITSPESAERICLGVVRLFKRLSGACYNASDQERGWIRAKGRDGQDREFPLVSISLAIVDCCGKCTLVDIGERSAEVKKYAKSKPGNCFVRDRRAPLGTKETQLPV